MCLDTGPCGILALGVPKQRRSGFLPGAASLRNFLSFSSLKSFLISLPYILPYTWEKRDNLAQKRDGSRHYWDGQLQNSTSMKQNRDGGKYKMGTGTLYNIKEERYDDD